VVGSSPLLGLRELIHPAGGFGSIVDGPAGTEVDRSGFVAAMVLRSLRHEPPSPDVAEIRRLSLDWLARCRSSAVPGAFAFWPEEARPAWAANVPPDVDDTVIMLGELLRHGRIDRMAALRGLCSTVLRRRVTPTEALVLPPWVVAGSFFTWLPSVVSAARPGARPVDLVDCCVNTNVVALMAMLGATHLPGFREAVETVLHGLSWAGDDSAKLRSLTPFYPSLGSLRDALEHAVECGVAELSEGLSRLRSLPPDPVGPSDALCGSAYGRSVWRAPAVGLARSIARRRTA
jgi:hypothetical protein